MHLFTLYILKKQSGVLKRVFLPNFLFTGNGNRACLLYSFFGVFFRQDFRSKGSQTPTSSWLCKRERRLFFAGEKLFPLNGSSENICTRTSGNGRKFGISQRDVQLMFFKCFRGMSMSIEPCNLQTPDRIYGV